MRRCRWLDGTRLGGAVLLAVTLLAASAAAQGAGPPAPPAPAGAPPRPPDCDQDRPKAPATAEKDEDEDQDAPARDDDQDVPEVEETVVVTATRSGRRLQDEPLRVEVIDREEIEEKALMTPGSVAMLLGETSGLRVQVNAPSLGAAGVRIQGLRGRYSQLLADGLPLYGAQGDSFSLLQVPPLDLAQVEVIKGAASALYGPAALGGVLNLVSRRAAANGVAALANATSLGGADGVVFGAWVPRVGWGVTTLAGYHGQPRRDLDDDGWTDVAGYQRGVFRPRVTWGDDSGGSLFVTGGLIAEDRRGGTVAGGVAPDGAPFDERLDTRRVDAGLDRRWVIGGRLAAVRGSVARTRHDRRFGGGPERSTRETWFGEGSLMGTAGAHTWVVGAALQQDRYRPRDLRDVAYTFTTPAVFAQDEVVVSDRVSVAASARLDAHSEYGVLVSPRLSALVRPAGAVTVRLSGGAGAFAPTPFVEETDETGLSRLVGGVSGLDPERAVSASGDVTWTRGAVEITGTAFGSRVQDPVALVTAGTDAVALVNLPDATRTWGTELTVRYRRGGVVAVASHAWTRATEQQPEAPAGVRREVPLTPRHAASAMAVWEGERWGRLGLEAYAIGRQSLEDNPFRTSSATQLIVGAIHERRLSERLRVFVNLENLGNVRLTRRHPLVRPARLPNGRWTVDAWAPLEGRVVNAGLRVAW